MKKFKLTWDERVCDDMGDTLYFEGKSQIIEAENEDVACDQWEKENEHNEYQNGLDDCVEVVESELFKKHLLIDMPDGLTYGIPVEIIARNRAEYYAQKEYDGDITESLRDDTLPLFEDISEIHDWASNNMNWSDAKKHAITLKKKISESEFQDAWVNGEWKVA
ncbi:hypothetical protein [Acinetobacter piscicola]|uniref:hypothetical protein n=1 Tax=Acinetobacter piscicola TaxID=2006115 RepID=UPI00101E9101|nr:hypothetical protein [Acinetobacter piscicola]RYL25079.1 hypothetical protein EWP19_12900 [Acinetobacter piscicola]